MERYASCLVRSEANREQVPEVQRAVLRSGHQMSVARTHGALDAELVAHVSAISADRDLRDALTLHVYS